MKTVSFFDLVFIDGEFAPKLSSLLPSGMALIEIEQGYRLSLSENVQIEKPLHLQFISEVKSLNRPMQFELHLEKCSSLNVFETHRADSQEAFQKCLRQRFHLEAGSSLKHAQFICENTDSTYDSHYEVKQSASSVYENVCFNLSAKSRKQELVVKLIEPYASTSLGGFFLATGDESLTHSILLSHEASNTQSQADFRGLASQKGKAAFHGLITVDKQLNAVSAKLYNKNCLLSDEAEIISRPELEILSDDVKCAHGATMGSLDKEAMRYLQSRGLSLEETKQILIHAMGQAYLERAVNQNDLPYFQCLFESALARVYV